MGDAAIRCSKCGKTVEGEVEGFVCAACKQSVVTAARATGQSPRPAIVPYATPAEPFPSRSNDYATASVLLAIASFGLVLVLNIDGSWLSAVASIPAIVLGILALQRLDRTAGGGKRAILGISLGGWMLLVVILRFGFGMDRNYGGNFRVKCAANLRSIGTGCALYANDWGVYPSNLGLLVKACDMTPDIFLCPASNLSKPAGGTIEEHVEWVNRNTQYVYLGATLKPSSPGEAILAYEKGENHVIKGINILFNDGSVQWHEKAQADVILKELEAGRNPPRIP